MIRVSRALLELQLPDALRVRRGVQDRLALLAGRARRHARGRLDLEVHDLVPRHALGHMPAARAVVRSPRRTPKSVDAYSVPSESSRTTSLTGRSPSSNGVGNADVPLSTLRFVNVPEPGRGAVLADVEHVARRGRRVRVVARVRDPRVARVVRVDVDAARVPGRRAPRWSCRSGARRRWPGRLRRRCASRRRGPADVAAQIVPVSALSRAIHEIEPPERSPP